MFAIQRCKAPFVVCFLVGSAIGPVMGTMGHGRPAWAGSKKATSELKPLAQSIAGGDYGAALEQLRELEQRWRRRAPLVVHHGRVLIEPPEGLGMYRAWPSGVVRGKEILLYAEVQNHGIAPQGTQFQVHLVSDLVIRGKDGTELARDQGFGESKFKARVPHRDTFVLVALNAAGLPKGRYVAELVINDRIGNKKSAVDIPFEIP